MRRVCFVFALALASALIACGGGSQVGPSSQPAPIPAPITTPTPVRGTQWSELPPLSDKAKEWLNDVNFKKWSESGKVHRWSTNSPITISIEGFSQAEIDWALNKVQNELLQGRLVFQVVSDRSLASITMYTDTASIPDSACGLGGPTRYTNNTFLQGRGIFTYPERPNTCSLSPESKRRSLAHELIHVIGIGGHDDTSPNLMGGTSATYNSTLSALTIESVRWLYDVPIGTEPIYTGTGLRINLSLPEGGMVVD